MAETLQGGSGNNKTKGMPPRLLIVTTVESTLKAFLIPYARHFRRLGWRVDAMARSATTCSQCVEAFDQTYEAPWVRSPWKPLKVLESSAALRQVVRQNAYDIVHVHTPVAAFVTRWSLRSRLSSGRPKVVYTAHGFHFHPLGLFWSNAAFLALERLAGRWTDQLIVINREDREAALRLGIVPPDRISYMPGIGVDTHELDPDRVDALEGKALLGTLGVGPESIPFLMVAEFNPGKRHMDLIHAMSQVQNENAVLLFAGSGAIETACKALVAKLGLSQKVRFLGFRRDLPLLIRACRALILPSEREGLPRSIMEALSLGVPVIGTNIRGVRDLVDDTCGILCDVGGREQLARAIDWMASHPLEAVAMGSNGRGRMRDFDLAKLLQLHESLYNSLLRPTSG